MVEWKVCKNCGHKDWEHQPECIHAIKHDTKDNWGRREYCKCKKFVEKGD